MKTLISNILILAILIVMITGMGTFLVSCKDMLARSPDDKPMVIYGLPPEPKEPAQPQGLPQPQGKEQPKQEKTK